MSDIPALPCYLNGEFGTTRDAKVSVLDRGFIFGDGIYEVVPAYQGRPFRFQEHMDRLDRSLGEMRMASTGPQLAFKVGKNFLFDTYLPVASTTTSRSHCRTNSMRKRCPSIPRGSLVLAPPIFQLYTSPPSAVRPPRSALSSGLPPASGV